MTVEILDTHQHLIYPDRFDYDWTAGIPALADKAFAYEDYLAAAADTIGYEVLTRLGTRFARRYIRPGNRDEPA